MDSTSLSSVVNRVSFSSINALFRDLIGKSLIIKVCKNTYIKCCETPKHEHIKVSHIDTYKEKMCTDIGVLDAILLSVHNDVQFEI